MILLVYCRCFRVSYFSPYIVIGWLVLLSIYLASAVFQPYRDLEAGDSEIPLASPYIKLTVEN